MIYTDLEKLKQDLPRKGRMMGLDLGTKTLGVAICDGDWLIANPKLTIARKGGKTDFIALQKIIEENKIVAIVLGLPINMDESENRMSGLSRRFAENLDAFLGGAKITLFDERLTSFEADEIMVEAKTKGRRLAFVVDQIAASVILQNTIDVMNDLN
ncbi:MAG: putative Holliday junction resolvase [Rickettsiales bacterium]|jgi:putative Holliday junction resolvase